MSTYRITGKVYCLNAETGDEIWKTTIDSPPDQDCVLFSPTVADGKVFVCEQYGKLHCFNADDGNNIWSVDMGYAEYRQCSKTPAVVNGKVYVNFGFVVGLGETYCFDANTGDELWNYSIGRSEYGSPAVVDGKVFVNGFNWSAIDGVLFCLNSTSGELIWRSQYGGSDNAVGWSSPAVCDDNVYVLSFRSLLCFDIESGNQIWREYINDETDSSPSIADGKVYFGSGTYDKFYCRSAENGSLIWSYELGNALVHPAIADGWVYIAAGGGTWTDTIYAFRDNEPPDAPNIDGPPNGKQGTEYTYNFSAIDPDNDDISEYFIDWGDNSNNTITGPFTSGEKVMANHTWTKSGTYTITAKAQDIYGAEGPEGTLEVYMPRDKSTNNILLLRLLERFPLLQKLQQHWF